MSVDKIRQNDDDAENSNQLMMPQDKKDLEMLKLKRKSLMKSSLRNNPNSLWTQS